MTYWLQPSDSSSESTLNSLSAHDKVLISENLTTLNEHFKSLDSCTIDIDPQVLYGDDDDSKVVYLCIYIVPN